MDSIKTFFNVGFVVLCLALLWYLFNSGSSEGRLPQQRPTVQTQGQLPTTINPNTRSDRRIGETPFRESDTRSNQQPVQTQEQPAPSQVNSQPVNAKASSEAVYVRRRYSRDNKWGEYMGPMKNGVPHGWGMFKYDDGDVFIGEYRNGQRNGYGNSIFKAKKVVLRKYDNGKRVDSRNLPNCSFGSKPFINRGEEGTYRGPIRGGNPTGYGYFEYKNGNMYIGTYQDGVRNGAGNMIYRDGSVERMEYVNGKTI